MENPQKYRYFFSNSETSGRKSFFSPMIISSFLTFTSFTCVYVWLYSYKSLSFTHALFTNHQFMFILYQINGTVSSTCYWAITFIRIKKYYTLQFWVYFLNDFFKSYSLMIIFRVLWDPELWTKMATLLQMDNERNLNPC